jgi:hypothetical protein
VENLSELPDIAAKIGMELRNQYLLGYSPQNQERDGKYRHVEVKAGAAARDAAAAGILENGLQCACEVSGLGTPLPYGRGSLWENLPRSRDREKL